MRPIEEFVYVGNQVIVPDQASLDALLLSHYWG